MRTCIGKKPFLNKQFNRVYVSIPFRFLLLAVCYSTAFNSITKQFPWKWRSTYFATINKNLALKFGILLLMQQAKLILKTYFEQYIFICAFVKTLVKSSDVLQAEYKGQKVAVKSLLDDSHAAQAFLAEASIMTYVDH